MARRIPRPPAEGVARQPPPTSPVVKSGTPEPEPPPPALALSPMAQAAWYMVAMGVIVGGLAGYADWDMSWLGATYGILAGLAVGATIGVSFWLPANLQPLVLLAMIVLSVVGYHAQAARGLGPMAVIVAAMISLLAAHVLRLMFDQKEKT